MDPAITELFDSLSPEDQADVEALLLFTLAVPEVSWAAAIEVSYQETLAASTPRVVHVEGAIVESVEQVRTFDSGRAPKGAKPAGHDEDQAGAPFWLIEDRTRRLVGPTDCPDCTKSLVARGAELICAQLPADRVELRACHDGCLIACGRPR